jgi:hypothetical protein
MSRNYFRAFGALTLLLNPALFSDAFDSTPTPTQFLRKLFLFSAVEIVGFGLAFLRKWAALFFSVPLFCFGMQEAYVSIYELTFPLNLLAMLHGLALTLPLVVTIRLWRQLTWGERFF